MNTKKFVIADDETIRRLADFAKSLPEREPGNDGPTDAAFLKAVAEIASDISDDLTCFPEFKPAKNGKSEPPA